MLSHSAVLHGSQCETSALMFLLEEVSPASATVKKESGVSSVTIRLVGPLWHFDSRNIEF